MEIRNVLVPVDFSPASQFAVDFAVLFARKFRARLTLLHVVESVTALTYTFPIESGKPEGQQTDRAFDRLSSMLSPEDQDDLDLQVRLRYGNAETEIRASIDDESASIVVMGTHHHGLIRRLLAGSVTEDMLRKMPVPVLIVSSDARSEALSRILFATDLTESSRDGFQFALDLARTVGSHLMVLHVIEPIPLAYGSAISSINIQEDKKLLIEDARRRLAGLESDGARQGVVVVSELAEGIASERILEAAENSAAELIVLTIHHKGLIERALLGTTAERVVRDTRLPVLSVPAHPKAVRFESEEQRRPSLPDPSAMP
jgi:nucleotide-binding universal stress UspA family protein